MTVGGVQREELTRVAVRNESVIKRVRSVKPGSHDSISIRAKQKARAEQKAKQRKIIVVLSLQVPEEK